MKMGVPSPHGVWSSEVPGRRLLKSGVAAEAEAAHVVGAQESTREDQAKDPVTPTRMAAATRTAAIAFFLRDMGAQVIRRWYETVESIIPG